MKSSQVLNLTEKQKDNKIIIGAGDTKQVEPMNDLITPSQRPQYDQTCAVQLVLWNLTKSLQITSEIV